MEMRYAMQGEFCRHKKGQTTAGEVGDVQKGHRRVWETELQVYTDGSADDGTWRGDCCKERGGGGCAVGGTSHGPMQQLLSGDGSDE